MHQLLNVGLHAKLEGQQMFWKSFVCETKRAVGGKKGQKQIGYDFFFPPTCLYSGCESKARWEQPQVHIIDTLL